MDDLPTIDYAHGPHRKGWARFAKPMAITACTVGAAATFLPLWPLWGFYNFPVGTSMRPMALVALLFLFAACGPFVALPLSIASLALSWRYRQSRSISLLALLLSLSAIFLGYGLFNWIVAIRHFVLED